jgi:asparagine synthase (glutamine-hydrolysing)
LVALVSAIPFAPQIGRGLRGMLAPVIGRVTSPKYAGLMEYGTTFADAYQLRRGLFMPWELPGVLGRSVVAQGLERLAPLLAGVRDTATRLNPYSAVAWLESTLYLRNQLLRDTDWSSMTHSLEIRTPFVDIDLFRALAPQLRGVQPPNKKMLIAGMSKPLQALIENRPKRGFQVPIREWMQQDGSAKGRMRGWRGWALDVMETFGGAPQGAREMAATS